ncbi:hypothetical protein [Maribacter sp. 2304DJ31-5]|uniref:hypothetical protein n=1 Tax=Maribacter sp. 2304DJ31-5 TaxID=3386273 RepID=UPI0039BD114F
MKNIYKLFMIMTLVLSTVSCETDDAGPGNNQNLAAGFVEISLPETTVSETSEETILLGLTDSPTQIEIPLKLFSTFNTDGVNVEFSTTLVAGSGNIGDIIDVSAATATIPAGTSEGNITIPFRTGLTFDLSSTVLVFDVTLTNVDSGFQAGLSNGSRNITHRITLLPAIPYTGSSIPENPISGNAGESGYDLILVPIVGEANAWTTRLTADNPRLELVPALNRRNSIIGPSFATSFGFGPYPGIIRVDPNTNEVTVEGTREGDFIPFPNPPFVTLPFVPVPQVQYPGTQEDITPDPVNNTFDPATGTFSFKLFQFGRFRFASPNVNYDPFDVVLTPN